MLPLPIHSRHGEHHLTLIALVGEVPSGGKDDEQCDHDHDDIQALLYRCAPGQGKQKSRQEDVDCRIEGGVKQHHEQHTCARRWKVYIGKLLLLSGYLLQRNSSRKRLVPALPMRNFTQGPALLPTLARRRDWIAKGEDRKNFDLLGNAENGLHLWEVGKTYPV